MSQGLGTCRSFFHLAKCVLNRVIKLDNGGCSHDGIKGSAACNYIAVVNQAAFNYSPDDEFCADG
ncbi:hypothetical protein KAM621c_23980 [Citrobacter braakii]|uniref:Uncharacterized protein n=1 Tax=Citrobacter braakii TaxID=57706 RepID=A0AAD1L1W2_CITBR|nr:hypothetical protein KAM621c_23980 [Citrobacter braakii]